MPLGFLRPRGGLLSSGTVCPLLACCSDAQHAQNHQGFSAFAIVPRNNRLTSSQSIEASELWLRKSRGCGGSAPAPPGEVRFYSTACDGRRRPYRVLDGCCCWCGVQGAHNTVAKRARVTSEKDYGSVLLMVAQYLFIGALLYLFPKAALWLFLAWAMLLHFRRR